MNKEKILRKLVRKAVIVKPEDIEIEESQFIDVSIEEFSGIKGELYFNQEADIFYKFLGKKWFRYKNRKEVQEAPEKSILMDLAQRLDSAFDMMKKIAEYNNNQIILLNNRITKLESEQQEFFRQIKENVDLQIKVATQKEDKKEDEAKKRVQRNKGSKL